MKGTPKRDSGWNKCRNLSSVSESLEKCLGEWGREGPKQHFLSADHCQTLHLKVCIVSNTEACMPPKQFWPGAWVSRDGGGVLKSSDQPLDYEDLVFVLLLFVYTSRKPF